ncbi:hypothetical protein, partial [Aeromonas caviae]|uniref:hypothetical protein n=1 Tax=Aeromonas caviae TaxID=648 RepID=UPI001CC6E21B
AASDQDSDFHNKAKHKLTYIPVIRDNDIPVTGTDQLQKLGQTMNRDHRQHLMMVMTSQGRDYNR